jgi:nicotinamide-nucleotide amidase
MAQCCTTRTRRVWVEQDDNVLCVLPGPPNELQPMFSEQVLPRLARLGLVPEREVYTQLRGARSRESALEVKLQPVFDQFGAALSIAFYAHQGQVDCRWS